MARRIPPWNELVALRAGAKGELPRVTVVGGPRLGMDKAAGAAGTKDVGFEFDDQWFRDVRAGKSSATEAEAMAADTAAIETHNSALKMHNEVMEKASKATYDLQKNMVKFGAVVTGVNFAFGAMAAGIRMLTLEASKKVAMDRGELSTALTLRMQQSKIAMGLKTIPFIGGAMGGMAQAMHENQQQRYGTEFMARAAAVFESSIPKMHSAIDSLTVAIASGAIGIRYAFAPAEGAYQQQMLNIHTGPGGQMLQGLAGQRVEVAKRVMTEQKNVFRIESLGEWEGSSESIYEARIRLRQAHELAAQYQTPQVLGAEKKVRGMMTTLETQAARQYQLQYYQGFGPSGGAAWASFGRMQAGPAGIPGVDPNASVNLTAAIKELTMALTGVNPVGADLGR